MAPSKVYFADLRVSFKENLHAKLQRLSLTAGIKGVIPPRGLVAVKLHFGEKGNTAYLRPTLVRQVINQIKSFGAFPFLTDANTLYSGARSNSVSHLITAVENGFAYSVMNAPIIIADGLRGGSSIPVRIDREILTQAHVGREIFEADALVSLAHFKGHELSGFGGTIKNVGMGCASRQGKMVQHSELSPRIKRKRCLGCGECVAHCAQKAIFLQEKKAYINNRLCVGCGECILICPQKAIDVRWNADFTRFQKKLAEYAFAALKNKEGRAVFLNFLLHISPACDCNDYSDAPIVPDLGIMASLDPVAIDQASVDMVNRQQALNTSCLSVHQEPGEDKFKALYPRVDWSIQLAHAEKIGLGSRDYELVAIS